MEDDHYSLPGSDEEALINELIDPDTSIDRVVEISRLVNPSKAIENALKQLSFEEFDSWSDEQLRDYLVNPDVPSSAKDRAAEYIVANRSKQNLSPGDE